MVYVLSSKRNTCDGDLRGTSPAPMHSDASASAESAGTAKDSSGLSCLDYMSGFHIRLCTYRNMSALRGRQRVCF